VRNSADARGDFLFVPLVKVTVYFLSVTDGLESQMSNVTNMSRWPRKSENFLEDEEG
jgi:hypothetical protein